MNSEICALFRRISPCVRFVEERRESARQNHSHGVGRLSRVCAEVGACIRRVEGGLCLLRPMFDYYAVINKSCMTM